MRFKSISFLQIKNFQQYCTKKQNSNQTIQQKLVHKVIDGITIQNIIICGGIYFGFIYIPREIQNWKNDWFGIKSTISYFIPTPTKCIDLSKNVLNTCVSVKDSDQLKNCTKIAGTVYDSK